MYTYIYTYIYTHIYIYYVNMADASPIVDLIWFHPSKYVIMGCTKAYDHDVTLTLFMMENHDQQSTLGGHPILKPSSV